MLPRIQLFWEDVTLSCWVSSFWYFEVDHASIFRVKQSSSVKEDCLTLKMKAFWSFWSFESNHLPDKLASHLQRFKFSTRYIVNWQYISCTLPCISQVLEESQNNTDAGADALRELEKLETSAGNHQEHHDHQHLSSDGFFCSSPSEMNVWLRL